MCGFAYCGMPSSVGWTPRGKMAPTSVGPWPAYDPAKRLTKVFGGAGKAPIMLTPERPDVGSPEPHLSRAGEAPVMKKLLLETLDDTWEHVRGAVKLSVDVEGRRPHI